ncbi:hypothetical protein GCM10009039_32130 [Halocalculus aciditolerans]|uniref:Uncharacterized protein n=1 Tax=Halocalculus aciditolerans TaxID=1383812 RepID=A0A830FQQ6_9EURY|nr:hypothetical protein GCM10009039_32130 [Halocalculus aciditolerans]
MVAEPRESHETHGESEDECEREGEVNGAGLGRRFDCLLHWCESSVKDINEEKEENSDSSPIKQVSGAFRDGESCHWQSKVDCPPGYSAKCNRFDRGERHASINI